MESTNVLAAALDNALDAILITDANLDRPGPYIVYVNASFCALSGYSAAELIGKSPRILQGPLTSRAVLDQLREHVAAGKSFSAQATNYRKDGSAFEIEWRISPVQSADGRITHYLSVHRDVTQATHFAKNNEQYVRQLIQEQQKVAARQAELENTNSRLQRLATTDGLTGLHNHRHFHEELSRLETTASPLSMLMLDVDHFKSFNDEFGHPAGDHALQETSRIIEQNAGTSAIVARYGGEEFAVLLPLTDGDGALAIAERVRRAAELLELPSRPMTLSIGVSTSPACGTGVGRSLLDKADVALYAAKAAGRNRVMHHRHVESAVRLASDTSLKSCTTPCAPSAGGCLRCETVPAARAARGGALLLGPQDLDAANTLKGVLSQGGYEFEITGPVMLVHNVKDRLGALGALLKRQLSPITQASIVATHVRGGVATAEQIMAALMFARPLSTLIQTLEHEWIREALNDEWLFSVFHPILDARSGDLFAQEALLRARNPESGQIMGAGQIINACEHLNLQHQLDQRARQTAIRGAARYVSQSSKIFINFLPNTIYDPAVCLRTTMETAAECNLSMDRLVFEVVETEKIPDMAHLHRILEYYRDRGVGTAIDDMGAGFTSLSYITSLRPNFVKLDREFVLSAEATAVGRSQMQRIVDSSHEHGAKVIAEGIETEAQMNLCTGAGVDLLQGFLFAKPACPPQTVTFSAASRRVA